MTPLSQRDPRWKDIKLGTGSTSIGQEFGVISFPIRRQPFIFTLIGTKLSSFSPFKFKIKFSTFLTDKINSFDTIFTGSTNSSVLSHVQDLQVFDSIVNFVTVFVVNLFFFFKRPTQVLFQNITVFINLLTEYANFFIPVRRNRSPFPIVVVLTIIPSDFRLVNRVGLLTARSRAILGRIQPILGYIKTFSTKLTGNISTILNHSNTSNYTLFT